MIDGQLPRLRQQFDSIVPAVADLRPAADSLWRTMQRPFAIDSASTVWFAMSPDGVSLAPLVGNGDAANTALVITAHPRIVVGAQPPAERKPLPSLTLAARPAGIHVPLEIEMPFDDLSRRATAPLSGEVAGKGITVGDINVWGFGDTVVVKVDVAGKISGALLLLGRIGYDPRRPVLISDLDTRSRARARCRASRRRSARRAFAMRSTRRLVMAGLRSASRSTGSRRSSARSSIASSRPGVMLSGAVTDVRIDRLYTKPRRSCLRVVFDARGARRRRDA